MSRAALTPSVLLRMMAPFVLATVLAFVLIATTAEVKTGEYLLAIALTLAVIGSIACLPWDHLPKALQLVPPLLFLLAAGFLRQSGGGAQSGVSAIALLPAFWLALHGKRWQLSLVLVGIAVFFLGPLVFIGGPDYPANGYRSAVVFLFVSAIVCFATQELVHKVRAQADEVARHTRDLQRVAAISRELATSADARGRVCEAAVELASASFAVLMEPGLDGGLISTAAAGLDAPEIPSGPPTLTALETAEPVFVADPAMLFPPVLRAGVPVGVLVIGWADRAPAGRRAAIISLLSAEAAFAIDTADLVERLTDLASVDSLTGVLNRRGWDIQVERAFADGVDEPLCVALLDF